jgi:hypothetical protein
MRPAVSPAADSPAAQRRALDAIATVLQDYFDGLHHSDVDRLSRVFHPQAVYATATGGTLLRLTMPEYFEMVAKRVSPASKGEPRSDRIDAITLAGPDTALARVRCAILPRRFNDLLSFVRVDGRWQIIAKVFQVDVDDT